MKPCINLLPLNYRRRRLMHRSLWWWLPVWLVCIVAATAYWLVFERSGPLDQQIMVAEQEVVPLNRLLRETASMRTRLKASITQGSLLGQMRNDLPPLSLLGAVSQSAALCKGRLFVERLDFQRKEQTRTTAGGSPGLGSPQASRPETREAWGAATLQGSAVDNVAVSIFVVGLRDSGLFRRVELKSCVRSSEGGRETRRYILECEI